MIKKTQHIRYFLFSQYLSDGVRITLEVILPAIVCSYLGRIDIGLLLSTGALCVSMGDAPGPLEHKKNGMLACNICIFLMSLLTGFLNHNMFLLGLLVLVASFFFSMISLFGIRASSVGIAALLIMVLRMDRVLPPQEVLKQSLMVLTGGLWYMLLALLFFWVRPFRQAQRSLGNCIHETSKLLAVKAALYNPETNVDEQYQKLLAQQVIVNETQDEARQLLFKGKEIVKDTSRTGQVMLITFTDVIDLYEQIAASWYDYDMLRVRFASTGILPAISAAIVNMAYELDRLGLAIQSNTPYKKQGDPMAGLTLLKTRIDEAKVGNESNLVLKKILVNLRVLAERLNALSGYFEEDIDIKARSVNRVDHSKFVSHEDISWGIFRDNLSLSSSAFRHALRMMITCVLGYVVLQVISYGHHSYWILLTIVFIMKPGYSLTKQRNLQRIAGTVVGGLVGVVLIATIKNRDVLLGLMIFLMIGTYTFQRLNYIVTVLFMTPYILILFSYLGLGFINIVEERVLDTAIASLLAFFASYFLFPSWESKQLEAYMISLLKANIGYLRKLRLYMAGSAPSLLEYKLARKELYVSTANLSAAFGRMLSEPKSKQQNAPEINQFVVLNNILSSNIASLFPGSLTSEKPKLTKEIVHPINRSYALLEDSLKVLEEGYQPDTQDVALTVNGSTTDQQMKEHVDFIYKVAGDIRKVVQKIAAA